MKDIFAIQCPKTSNIVAISQLRYGLVPLPVEKNKEYGKWVSSLEKEGLKPIFKILDKVNEDDLEILFEMYLGLFKSWNIPLYNFEGASCQPWVFQHFFYLTNDKYLLNDIGRFNSSLELFTRLVSTKKINQQERAFCYELILYCWLKCNYDLDSRDIKDLRKDTIRSFLFNHSASPIHIKDCYNYLNTRIFLSDKKKSLFFHLEKFSLNEIIGGLNFMFLTCHVQLFFSKTIWDNLRELYLFLNNSKALNNRYEIGVLFSKLQLDKKKQLTPKEYENFLTKIPMETGIFPHLVSNIPNFRPQIL